MKLKNWLACCPSYFWMSCVTRTGLGNRGTEQVDLHEAEQWKVQMKRLHASVQKKSNLAGRFPGVLVDKMNVSVQRILQWSRLTRLPGLHQCGGLALTWHQVPTKAALPLPASTGQDGKHNKRLMSLYKDGERSLTNYQGKNPLT